MIFSKALNLLEAVFSTFIQVAMSLPDIGKTVPDPKKSDILDLVGGDGPWQRRVFAVIFCCAIPLACHNMGMSFLAPNVDHWCARTPEFANLSVKEWRIIGLPPNDNKCSRYKFIDKYGENGKISNSSIGRTIVKCDSWEYDDSFYYSTIVNEFDLVCDREWLVSMSKSIFIAGYFCTMLVFGHVSDRFGRRTVISICNVIAVISATVSLFSASYFMFGICRFFIAVGVAGVFSTSFVLLMEVIGPEHRSFYGMVVNFGFSLGCVSLPVIAWLTRDWFWMQFVMTVPCYFLLSSWWLLPESPRWLLSRGKTEETVDLLLKIGSINKKTFPDMENQLRKATTKATEVHGVESGTGNIFQLFTAQLRRRTMIICFSWFVISFVYYGLSYNTNDLAGDPFVNFALYAVIEIPAYFFPLFVIRKWGRRNPMAFTLITGGAACLAMYPIPQDPWWISVSVSLFGKFCITCSFAILYIFTVELFPTVLRNIGLGSASMCGRSGSFIAPFMRELGYATHPVVPQLLFGVLAATSGFLGLLLPETNNTTVPDTIEEAGEMS
ncbi:hypothetical protein JTE90_008944 [Oedothorax gibbosus]|uniref:Major facilitator superfamily (MFS) profile domain-containing protein n=1 Tax=Oedothorax gibbosus TaxID=931172 RepID=A0AAV6UN03_9ARAC|nr:hypothetical protein JTE90_008944 [Oedothorax gibbosus]